MRLRFLQLAWIVVLAFMVAACSSVPGDSSPGAEPTPRTVTAAPLPAESDWFFGGDSTLTGVFAGCLNYAYKDSGPVSDDDFLGLYYAEATPDGGSRLLTVDVALADTGGHVVRSSVASLKFAHPEATFTAEAEFAVGASWDLGLQEIVRVHLSPYQRGVLLGNPQDTLVTIIGSHGTRSVMFEKDAWAWLSHAAVCLE